MVHLLPMQALTEWLDGSRRSLRTARHFGEAAFFRRARYAAPEGQGRERSERLHSGARQRAGTLELSLAAQGFIERSEPAAMD